MAPSRLGLAFDKHIKRASPAIGLFGRGDTGDLVTQGALVHPIKKPGAQNPALGGPIKVNGACVRGHGALPAINGVTALTRDHQYRLYPIFSRLRYKGFQPFVGNNLGQAMQVDGTVNIASSASHMAVLTRITSVQL